MLDFDRIKGQVGCNEPATEAQIKICNLRLKQNNLPELPTDYCDILKIYNGLSNEDASVFGVEIKNNNWYEDVADFNISYFNGNSAQWLILGKDNFFFFVYDAEQKMYYIVDRDTMDDECSSPDVAVPINYILRIE